MPLDVIGAGFGRTGTTVRDPDSWFRSTQATIFRPEHLVRLENRPHAPFLKNGDRADLCRTAARP